MPCLDDTIEIVACTLGSLCVVVDMLAASVCGNSIRRTRLAGDVPLQTAATRRTVFPGIGSAGRLPAPVRQLRARVARGVMAQAFGPRGPEVAQPGLGSHDRWLAASCRAPRISGRCTNPRRADDNHSKRVRPRAVRLLAAAPAFCRQHPADFRRRTEQAACRRIETPADVMQADETVPAWAEAFDDAGRKIRIGIPFVAPILKLVPALTARHDARALSHDLDPGGDDGRNIRHGPDNVTDPCVIRTRLARLLLPDVITYRSDRPVGLTVANQNRRHPQDDAACCRRDFSRTRPRCMLPHAIVTDPLVPVLPAFERQCMASRVMV